MNQTQDLSNYSLKNNEKDLSNYIGVFVSRQEFTFIGIIFLGITFLPMCLLKI